MSKETRPNPTAATNRRARFDYEIVDKYIAGIALSGCEVKSLRDGGASLTDSWAQVRGTELFLSNMYIKPYDKGGFFNDDPRRERKLLLHRSDINKLIGAVSMKGMTLVPLRVFFNERGWAKVEIALAKGKKSHDKRDAIRERDEARELAREYKLR